VLKRLINAVKGKQGELQRDCLFILHRDSALAHSLLQVSQFLARKVISSMYYPDLSSADFWLFEN
jgi:hypothetical protein